MGDWQGEQIILKRENTARERMRGGEERAKGEKAVERERARVDEEREKGEKAVERKRARVDEEWEKGLKAVKRAIETERERERRCSLFDGGVREGVHREPRTDHRSVSG